MTIDKHYGIVLDNKDHEAEDLNDGLMRGRLKVQVDTLLVGDEDGTEAEFGLWADPAFPFTGNEGSGWFFVPPIGAEVELEYDTDELGSLQDLRWVAGIYSDENDIPEQFKINYPERRGFRTPGGHMLMFDDTDGSHLMTLSSPAGQFVNFDSSGDILIANSTGMMIIVSKADKMIALIDGNQNIVQMHEDGITVVDKHGNFASTARDKIQMVSAGDIAIQGGNVNIDGGTVNIGNPNGPPISALLGGVFAILYDGHFHTAPPLGGSTTPPVVPLATLKGTAADPIAKDIKLKPSPFGG